MQLLAVLQHPMHDQFNIVKEQIMYGAYKIHMDS